MRDFITKTESCTCPKCGRKNEQVIQSPYPMYDKRTDSVIKWFICEDCLMEWYEHYKPTYEKCGVIVFNNETVSKEIVEFDNTGRRMN